MPLKSLFLFLTGQSFICYFGGGGGKDPAKAPAPIQESSLDVSSAGRSRKKQLGRRQGLASTVLAGGNPGFTTGKSKLSGES